MGNFKSHSSSSHSHCVPQHNSHQHQPTYIAGRPAPQYIRSITIENTSNTPLICETRHKSQQLLHTQINPRNSLIIQRIFKVDQCNQVDPIKTYVLRANTGQVVMQGDDSTVNRIQAMVFNVAPNLQVNRTK